MTHMPLPHPVFGDCIDFTSHSLVLLATFSCSDVFTILQEIQRTWSYLEPLFIGSEEVKKELPEDAKRFEGIDTDVKDLLKSVSSETSET